MTDNTDEKSWRFTPSKQTAYLTNQDAGEIKLDEPLKLEAGTVIEIVTSDNVADITLRREGQAEEIITIIKE